MIQSVKGFQYRGKRKNIFVLLFEIVPSHTPVHRPVDAFYENRIDFCQNESFKMGEIFEMNRIERPLWTMS